MSTIETLRGFVNAWDCDENDHLNVQFYFGFFEDAAAQFFAMVGQAPDGTPELATRHVRFHSELRGGQLVVVDSHAVRGQSPGSWHLVHRMSEPATGRLAATALDTFRGAAAEAGMAEVPAEARPRSLALSPADVGDLAARTAPTTHRGRLGPEEIGPDGHPWHRAVVARFSDAAPHFWEAMGATQPWLAERGLGRVALEMKVTRGAVAAGPIDLTSAPLAVAAKTVSFFHVVRASASGQVIAAGEVTALLFDQRRRRSIELPEEIRATVENLLAATV